VQLDASMCGTKTFATEPVHLNPNTPGRIATSLNQSRFEGSASRRQA
jgi:hypothetical protein